MDSLWRAQTRARSFSIVPTGILSSVAISRSVMSTDLWPYVERIRVPTLLVIGAESALVTPEKLARMKKSIPELTSVTILGATHMVPQDRPAEFEKAVRDFMAKIS